MKHKHPEPTHAIDVPGTRPGMLALISLALTVAVVASAATTFGWLDLDFWWELALLVTIMLLGHWLGGCALGETQRALEALADPVPEPVRRASEAWGSRGAAALYVARNGAVIGVLAPWGISMPPAPAAVLMSLSSIIVALNAQFLRRVDIRPDGDRHRRGGAGAGDPPGDQGHRPECDRHPASGGR